MIAMRRINIMLLCCLLSLSMWAAGSLRIVVEAGQYDRQDCIVSVEISKLKLKQGSEVVLFEKTGKTKTPVACQVIQDGEEAPVLY